MTSWTPGGAHAPHMYQDTKWLPWWQINLHRHLDAKEPVAVGKMHMLATPTYGQRQHPPMDLQH